MGFGEGHTAGEKWFNGRVFPLTLSPPSTCESSTCDDLVDLVQGERAWLDGALRRHGAILLRGFAVESTEDFSRAVEAFGWDEFEHQGLANRVKVVGRVIRTVNEPPLELLINFHHEMALIKESPAKIFFFCTQRSPEGGQTAVIPSDVIVEKMEERVPRVVEKLVRDGMTTVFHTTVWQQMFKTDDKHEAERRALEKLACDSVEFNNDGSADITHGPMSPIREMAGKRIWLNSMLGYSTTNRVAYVRFGDGSPIPQEAIDAYEKILEENGVDVNWQKGDVLLVDNTTVQHARRPGKPPRQVVLSLSM